MFRTICCLVLAVAVLPRPGSAQEDRDAAFGFGVALNPIALVGVDDDFTTIPLGFGNFTIPIRLGEQMRIEPELGITRASTSASGSGFDASFSETVLRFGASLHFMLTGDGSFRPYVGARGGLMRHSRSEDFGGGGNDRSRTDNYLGIAVGGEHWFTNRFSLGAEVQLNRVGVGDEGDGGAGDPNVSSSLISNSGVISVRFYLF